MSSAGEETELLLEEVIPNFPLMAKDMDNFTHLLTVEDARVMVDLLKLAVAKRVGERGRETMAAVLTAMAKTNKEVREGERGRGGMNDWRMRGREGG